MQQPKKGTYKGSGNPTVIKSITTYKNKKGTTTVDKDTNTGKKTVTYNSNKKNKTYTKVSELKKGGSVKKK